MFVGVRATNLVDAGFISRRQVNVVAGTNRFLRDREAMRQKKTGIVDDEEKSPAHALWANLIARER